LDAIKNLHWKQLNACGSILMKEAGSSRLFEVLEAEGIKNLTASQSTYLDE